MDFFSNYLPDNKTIDYNLFVLDPLSTIIKLAILSNKLVGTKMYIDKNIIHFQEPGIFQALCRYILKTNKTDLQYLYNPIELACKQYLSKHSVQQNPKLKDLFKCAQKGLLNLSETYKYCSIIRISLNYYSALISNYLEENNNETLFKKDNMSILYTETMLTKMNKIWTQDKIKIILNLTTFLTQDEHAESDVKSLETLMINIDKSIQQVI
jgi:hypothetical protein